MAGGKSSYPRKDDGGVLGTQGSEDASVCGGEVVSGKEATSGFKLFKGGATALIDAVGWACGGTCAGRELLGWYALCGLVHPPLLSVTCIVPTINCPTSLSLTRSNSAWLTSTSCGLSVRIAAGRWACRKWCSVVSALPMFRCFPDF